SWTNSSRRFCPTVVAKDPDMQTLLEIGLVNAVMATGLAFMVALIGRFCRRPGVMHLLWIFVLLKLVTPPAMWVPYTWPSPLLGTPVDSRAMEPDPPLAANEDSQEDAVALLLQDTSLCGDLADAATTDSDSAPAEAEAAPASPAVTTSETPLAMLPMEWFTEHWPACMFITWLAGSVTWFAVVGLRIHCFHRLLRFGKPAPSPLQDEAQLLAQRIGLHKCPLLWVV